MKSLTKHVLGILAMLILAAAILAFILADLDVLKRMDSVSTIVLAVLTAAYVIFTYQILKATRPQPHVFASLPRGEDIEVYLSIKNIGNRPAYDVKVTFSPDLDLLAPTNQFKGAAGPLLNQPFMPPESEVRNFVSSTLTVLSLPEKDKRFKVDLTYFDSKRRSYSDSYYIDLSSYIFVKKFSSAKK